MESFRGLLAPATAAHIHCCGPVGVNEPVVLPFLAAQGGPFGATSGTFTHTFNLNTDLSPGTITAAQFVAGLKTVTHMRTFITSHFPAAKSAASWRLCPNPVLFSCWPDV